MTDNRHDSGHPRLESWKEIGAYLQRDVRTARRWELEEGLPVHRHSHKSRSSVYAYPAELDAWRMSRKVVPEPAPVRPLWKIPAFAVTLLLCLIMVGSGMRTIEAQQPGKAKTSRQVWVTRRSDSPLNVSPDGRHFAFVDWSTGGDLAVRDLTTGTEHRLTKNTGREEAEDAMFSPDGRQIAYVWQVYKENEQRWDLSVIPVAGGNPRTLWSKKSPREALWPEGWTPDGKQLLVYHGFDDRTAQLEFLSIQDGVLHPVRSFGKENPKVSLSPDGHWIAYDHPPDAKASAKDVYVMAADGSREISVIQNPANDSDPIWSPDGSRILFRSNRDGRLALWSVPFVNGKPGKEELVKTDPGRGIWISRNGTLYQMNPGIGGTNIYRAELDANGKVSTPAIAVKNFINKSNAPFLSPDGQYLAFRAEDSLLVETLKTGEERIVPTEAPGGLWGWFPDGRSILMTRPMQQGLGANFLRIDLTTGKAESLFQNQTHLPWGVSLSPDGRTVFYSEPSRLVRFDRETQRETEMQKVATGLNSFYSVALSPDGKQLAYIFWTGGPTHSIMIVPASGGTPREVFRSDEITRYNSLGWTPDQKYVLVTAGGIGSTLNANAKYMLWRVPTSGGPAEQTGLSLPDVHFPQIHPDGRTIFFQSNDTGVNEIWVFENFLPKGNAAK